MNTLRPSRWLVLLLLLTGCRSTPETPEVRPPLSSADRTAIQSCTYYAPVDVVFSATIATLQDLGWELDTVDKASGLIRATTQKRLEPLGPQEEAITNYKFRRQTIQRRTSEKDQWTRWEEMVIHTEPWTGGQTRQRLVFNRHGSMPALSYKTKLEGKEGMINAPAREERVEMELREVYADVFARITKAVAERVHH